MRVHFTNLGCKLNQAELERLARRFVDAGHRIAPTLEDADLHVVNSCTVTSAAARDSRKVARRGRRRNPALRTVLTGCWVAADRERAAALAGVDLIVGNRDKERLLERVHAAFPEMRPRPARSERRSLPEAWGPLEFGNSRALVKIEDGCNMRCAFCIIPRTRGPQQSRPLGEVVGEVRALAEGGFEEVVVTGVQISAYRRGDLRLYELVRTLLAETPVRRLRLTSIAPWQFDERLLELFDSGRLCRHFHLSLQSGCDATLERMRRPYTAADFGRLAARIRRAVPGVALTTDVIVGFPGESDGEFERSLAFVAESGFARIHAFPFSARPGTEAATLDGHLEHRVVRRRMRRMLEVAERSRLAFWRSRLGERLEALWERPRDGHWLGTTDNYIPVRSSNGAAPGLADVRLLRVTENAVVAGPARALQLPLPPGASSPAAAPGRTG